jgi:intergrase/recombinase
VLNSGHYKYADIFLRRTKKPYVSIATKPLLELASNCGHHNYNAIFMLLKWKKIPVRMKNCRKIFATYMRLHGVEPEFIDLLQGRIPKSVFARHYFRPDFDKEMTKIRNNVLRLYREVA